jgi:tripartite-type tricarboxylate transporter receptor subunit TctC
MVIEGVAALAGAVEGGAMKAIAVGAPKRLPNFPKIPAAAETLPGFNARGWVALVAPNGTPPNIVAKVGDALRKSVSDPEVQKKVVVTGNYLRAMSPKEVMAYVNAEQQMWKPILEKIAAAK